VLKHTLRVLAALFVTLLGQTAARGVEHTVGHGEPYVLAGKRMVFTNWIYVRPGRFDWANAKGESVYSSPITYKPGDVTFRTFHFPRGVRLITEPAQRPDKPFIANDRPWEAKGIGVGTLMRDEGKYRLWGWSQDAGGVCHPCYFESKDGVTWEKPSLGLVAFEGKTQNNILPGMFYQPAKPDPAKPQEPSYSVLHFSVFKDPNPNVPPAERYKSAREGDADMALFGKDWKGKSPYSIMALETDPGRAHAIIGAVSPDGLTWTDLPQAISIEPSDTYIAIEFDAISKKYVLFTRSYMVAPRAPGKPMPPERIHAFLARRAIGRGESADFKRFPPSDVIVEPENDWAPTDVIYTNAKTTIPGAPDHHVMFPAIYHTDDDTMSVMFYSSYDAKVWHKASTAPVLPTAEEGKFDGGCVLAYPHLTELPNGDWVLPYTGFNHPHKFPRGGWSPQAALATWPKGRLAAIEAMDKGEFWTVGFIPPGRKIRINAMTARAGGVKIEVCDFDGNPVAGRTLAEAQVISGDHFRTPLKWGQTDDIGVAKDQPVILHFVMDRAKIYGLDFE
jgi:hypothetical protein